MPGPVLLHQLAPVLALHLHPHQLVPTLLPDHLPIPDRSLPGLYILPIVLEDPLDVRLRVRNDPGLDSPQSEVVAISSASEFFRTK